MTNKKRKNQIAKIIRRNVDIDFVESMNIAKAIVQNKPHDQVKKIWREGCDCGMCDGLGWSEIQIASKTISFVEDGLIEFVS